MKPCKWDDITTGLFILLGALIALAPGGLLIYLIIHFVRRAW